MFFLWSNTGYNKEVKAGAKVCGLSQNRQRPDRLILSFDDLTELLRLDTELLRKNMHMYRCALSIRKGENYNEVSC